MGFVSPSSPRWGGSGDSLSNRRNSAFRQMPVEPPSVAAAVFMLNDHVMMNLRLQVGWRKSPGFWSIGASALAYTHSNSSLRDAVVCEQGMAAITHVSIDAGTEWETIPIPPDCERLPASGGDAGDQFTAQFYVDDGSLIEVHFFHDGYHLTIKSLASDRIRLLGPRESDDAPLLEAHNIRVGYILGSVGLGTSHTISLPPHTDFRVPAHVGTMNFV